MIVDSSAVIAIIRGESDRELMASALRDAPTRRIGAATLLETCTVAGRQRWDRVDELVDLMEVVAFTRAHVLVAREAYARYGKGSGSPARLNLGDCFSYALAKVSGEPLLFKGDDFTHTDVVSALRPDPPH